MTLGVILAALLQIVQPAQARRVQSGTLVRPETTTVGQHFIVTVRVRAPAGARVTFPARPDTAARVDSAAAAVRTDVTANGFTESTVNYVLAAWDTGAQRLGLDSVSVVTGTGVQQVPLGGLEVYVRSVLPRDSALRQPKPFKPVVALSTFNWLPWLIAAAVAALIGIIAFAWRAVRRRGARGLTALQVAEREFTRIESERLVEAGQSERYAVEMVEVVRVYLARVLPSAARSTTTYEIATALSRTTVVPAAALLNILRATDLVKFARERITAQSALDIGIAARRIVAETAAAIAAEAATAAKSTRRAA